MKGKKYILLKAKIPVWLKYWAYKKGGVTPVLKNLYLGYSRQKTTTGANIQKFNPRTSTVSGATYVCNDNGQVTIKGNSVQYTALGYNYGDNLMSLQAGTYKMKVIGNCENVVFSYSNGSITLNEEQEATITLSNDTQEFRISQAINPNLSFDCDYYITLTRGDIATTERYTGGIPAPNPNYAMEIENLTGNVPIQAGNKIITFPLAEGQRFFADTMLTPNGILFVNDRKVFDGEENFIYVDIQNGNLGTYLIDNNVSINTEDQIIVISNYLLGVKPSVTITNGEIGISSRRGATNKGFYIRIPDTIANSASQFKTYLRSLYNSNKPFIAEYKRVETLLVPYTEAQLQAYTNLCKYFEENTDLNDYIIEGG